MLEPNSPTARTASEQQQRLRISSASSPENSKTPEPWGGFGPLTSPLTVSAPQNVPLSSQRVRGGRKRILRSGSFESLLKLTRFVLQLILDSWTICGLFHRDMNLRQRAAMTVSWQPGGAASAPCRAGV